MSHYTPTVKDVSARAAAPPFAKRAGRHRLAGVVTVDGVPAQRRIALLSRYSLTLIATVLSRPDGTWEMVGLPTYAEGSLFIVAFDETGAYNAEVADWISQTS